MQEVRWSGITSSIIHKTSNIFSESTCAQMQETRWEWNREITHLPSAIIHLTSSMNELNGIPNLV